MDPLQGFFNNFSKNIKESLESLESLAQTAETLRIARLRQIYVTLIKKVWVLPTSGII